MAQRAVPYPPMEPQRHPTFVPSNYSLPSQLPIAAMMPVYAAPVPQMNPEAMVFGPSTQVSAPPAATTERLVEGNMPFSFFTRPPRNHPAQFSTEGGTKPFRYLPDDWDAAPVRTAHSNTAMDINKKIQSLKEKFSPEILQGVREPPQWSELFLWFDAVEIWVEGAEFLFRVLAQLELDNKFNLKARLMMEQTATEWVNAHQFLLLNNQETKDFVNLFDRLDLAHFVDMTQIEVVTFRDMINRLAREFISAYHASQPQMQPRVNLYDVPELGQGVFASYPSRFPTYGSLQPAMKANRDPRYTYAWGRQRSGTDNAPQQRDATSFLQNRPRGSSNDIARKHQNSINGQFLGQPIGNAASGFQRPEPIYALNPQYRGASEPTQRPHNNRSFSNTYAESNRNLHHQTLPARPPIDFSSSRATSYESTGTVKHFRKRSSDSQYHDQPAARRSYQDRVSIDAQSSMISDSLQASNPQSKHPVSSTSGQSQSSYVDSKNVSWKLQYNRPKHSNSGMPLGRYFAYVKAPEASASYNSDHTLFVSGVDEHEHFLNHRLRDEMERAGDTVQQITFLRSNCVFVTFVEGGAAERALQLWNSRDAPLRGCLTVQEKREKVTPRKSHHNDFDRHQEYHDHSNYGSPQRGSHPNFSRQQSSGQDIQGQSPVSAYIHRSAVADPHSFNTGFNSTFPLGRIENHANFDRSVENPFSRHTMEVLGSPLEASVNSHKKHASISSPQKQGSTRGDGSRKENQRPGNHSGAEHGELPRKRASKFKGKSSRNSSNHQSPTRTPTKSRSHADFADDMGCGPRQHQSFEEHSTTRHAGSTKKNTNKKKKKHSKGSNANSGSVSRNDSNDSFVSNSTTETSTSTMFDMSKRSTMIETDASFSTNSSRKLSVEDKTTSQTETTPRPAHRKISTIKSKSSDSLCSSSASTPTLKALPEHDKQQGHIKKGSSSSSVRKADSVKMPKLEGIAADTDVSKDKELAPKSDECEADAADDAPESPITSKIDVEDKDAWPSLVPARSPVTNIADGKRPPPPAVTPLNYKQAGLRGMSGSDKARSGQVPIAVPKIFQGKK